WSFYISYGSTHLAGQCRSSLRSQRISPCRDAQRRLLVSRSTGRLGRNKTVGGAHDLGDISFRNCFSMEKMLNVVRGTKRDLSSRCGGWRSFSRRPAFEPLFEDVRPDDQPRGYNRIV